MREIYPVTNWVTRRSTPLTVDLTLYLFKATVTQLDKLLPEDKRGPDAFEVTVRPTPLAVRFTKETRIEGEQIRPIRRLTSQRRSTRRRAVQRSGRGPARWCSGFHLSVSAVSGFVPD